MALYSRTINRTEDQNRILNLEKKYMDQLEGIFLSREFKNDLRKIDNEINTHYSFLREVWGKTNKIKEASERLVRHHLYKSYPHSSFFSSPVSCDVALELDDVILNVDIKTINVLTNKGDLNTTQFEHNQTSFNNSAVETSGAFPGFRIRSNLQSVDPLTGKPVLTYLIKISYVDDNNGYFSLVNDTSIPSLVLTCLPNGQLSNLFSNNLFLNFKTYKYYENTADRYYKPRRIEYCAAFNTLDNNSKFTRIENSTVIPEEWRRVIMSTGGKVGYYDPTNSVLWIEVARKIEGVNTIYLEAVKDGDTARFNDLWLKERYDSNDSYWLGQRKYFNIY